MSKQPDEKETSSNFADKGEGDQAASPLFATDVNWTLAGIFSQQKNLKKIIDNDTDNHYHLIIER